jgi:hypothetical protein
LFYYPSWQLSLCSSFFGVLEGIPPKAKGKGEALDLGRTHLLSKRFSLGGSKKYRVNPSEIPLKAKVRPPPLAQPRPRGTLGLGNEGYGRPMPSFFQMEPGSFLSME